MSWTGVSAGERYRHNITFPETGFAIGEAQDVQRVWKLVCHFLIDQLPLAAVQEAAESLGDIAQFHRSRMPAELPRLMSTPVKGRVTSTQIRPPFELSEE